MTESHLKSRRFGCARVGSYGRTLGARLSSCAPRGRRKLPREGRRRTARQARVVGAARTEGLAVFARERYFLDSLRH
jgi:hypothetical protein